MKKILLIIMPVITIVLVIIGSFLMMVIFFPIMHALGIMSSEAYSKFINLIENLPI